MSNHDARMAIEAITSAMSSVLRLEISDNTLSATAYEHLADARRLLIAKYQPNTEEIGR